MEVMNTYCGFNKPVHLNSVNRQRLFTFIPQAHLDTKPGFIIFSGKCTLLSEQQTKRSRNFWMSLTKSNLKLSFHFMLTYFFKSSVCFIKRPKGENIKNVVLL